MTQSTAKVVGKLNKVDCTQFTDKYVFFWSGFLSQFADSPFVIDNVTYKFAEHWMMASKARLMNDPETLQKIMNSSTPSQMKSLGRKVKNWDQQKWDKNKEDIVYKGSYAKFKQNSNLQKRLLAYGNRTFVEASPYDKIWGIGLGVNDKCDCTILNDKNNWKGLNLLGYAITKARDQILKENNSKN